MADGTIEGLKWLALVLMTGDHVNKYLFNATLPVLFEAGRIALPLFVFVLAYNLARPGTLDFASTGNGSASHLAGELLNQRAGIDTVHIPYKGGAPALQDLMGGQVPVAFNVVSEVLPHVRSGKLRALALTSPQRWPALPEVPTLVELGFKDIALVEFLGWYAPARTPTELVHKLNAAVQDALGSPEMQEVFTRTGLQPLREGPEAFALRVRDELTRWAPIVKATGFTAED